MSKRDRIQLTAAEQLELLEAERVVVVSSLGPHGWPHSMPMWFVVRDGEIWFWTYGRSQKVRNLERDPRATLLVETGEAYGELRGVMIEAEATEALAAQARKRVAVRCRAHRTATWDHRKL